MLTISTLNTGAFDFATFLFCTYLVKRSLGKADEKVVQIFPDTLVPVSLVGLCTKSVGLSFSGWVGGLVDVTPRLAFVRRAIVCQKVSLSLPRDLD